MLNVDSRMNWFDRNLSAKQPETKEEDMASYGLLRKSLDNSSSHDSDYEVDIAYVPKKKSLSYYLKLLAKGVLIALAFYGLFSIGRLVSDTFKSHEPVSCSCGGTTSAEARSRGCVFSPLALSWLPPQCLDQE